MSRLPFSLKVLLENLLRHEDGITVTADDIRGLAGWDPDGRARPRDRVPAQPRLAPGFHGRTGGRRPGGDARRDEADGRRSQEDQSACSPSSSSSTTRCRSTRREHPWPSRINAELEFQRNRERYAFLRWGQNAFENFRVVPPDTGIVHQVNLEYLARVVFTAPGTDGRRAAGLSRHAGRHRLAHHDDQRPGRAGLGRRRHRGRGGDAGPAGVDAGSPGRRLQADRDRFPKGRRPPTWC